MSYQLIAGLVTFCLVAGAMVYIVFREERYIKKLKGDKVALKSKITELEARIDKMSRTIKKDFRKPIKYYEEEEIR